MLYCARPFALRTIVSTYKHRTIRKFFIPAIWLCIPQWASSLQKSRSLSTSLIAGQRHLPWESESCRICPRILNPINHRRAVLVDDQNDRPGRHEDGVHFSRLANVFSEINIAPHHPVERPRRSWHEDGYPSNRHFILTCINHCQASKAMESIGHCIIALMKTGTDAMAPRTMPDQLQFIAHDLIFWLFHLVLATLFRNTTCLTPYINSILHTT